MTATRLPAVVRAVEARLADFYAFTPGSDAASHLVTKSDLRTTLGDGVTALPEYEAPGGVFLNDRTGQSEGDLYIGIHLDDRVERALASVDPTVKLGDDNLEAFCVVIEEVSHFHLIVNRALGERSVSKLELEWQGEIDKLLVCALTLQEQHGDPHLEPLARRLYDGAKIVAVDEQLYWEATRHAARFWRRAERTGDPMGKGVRALLRDTYRGTWTNKLARIA